MSISMTYNHRLFLLALLLALFVLVITGCAKRDDVIKIGVITPLTGDGATYGEATKRGVDLAVNEMNSAGGILSKRIHTVYEDDQMNPQVATSALQRLINIEKVPVVLGAFGSSVTLAIAPIAEKYKVVLFSASSTADALRDAGDYFFRNVPSNSEQGKSAADFVAKQLHGTTAAVLLMNNDYGVSLSLSFKSQFLALGGTIVAEDRYNPGDVDFRSQLTKIAHANPNVIFYPGHYQESGLILRQAREMGISAIFVGGDGSYSPDLDKIAGDAAEGSYYTLMSMGYNVADSQIAAYTLSYKTAYGQEPDVYSAYAYDAIRIICQAIQRGGYTSQGIKTALYNTKDYLGVTGKTSFDALGEVNKKFYIYRVTEGRFVIDERN